MTYATKISLGSEEKFDTVNLISKTTQTILIRVSLIHNVMLGVSIHYFPKKVWVKKINTKTTEYQRQGIGFEEKFWCADIFYIYGRILCVKKEHYFNTQNIKLSES